MHPYFFNLNVDQFRRPYDKGVKICLPFEIRLNRTARLEKRKKKEWECRMSYNMMK